MVECGHPHFLYQLRTSSKNLCRISTQAPLPMTLVLPTSANLFEAPHEIDDDRKDCHLANDRRQPCDRDVTR
jgi:hypothetical protein